jgi:hypothetical protein
MDAHNVTKQTKNQPDKQTNKQQTNSIKRVLLEKALVTQLVKKITMFVTAHKFGDAV